LTIMPGLDTPAGPVGWPGVAGLIVIAHGPVAGFTEIPTGAF